MWRTMSLVMALQISNNIYRAKKSAQNVVSQFVIRLSVRDVFWSVTEKPRRKPVVYHLMRWATLYFHAIFRDQKYKTTFQSVYTTLFLLVLPFSGKREKQKNSRAAFS